MKIKFLINLSIYLLFWLIIFIHCDESSTGPTEGIPDAPVNIYVSAYDKMNKISWDLVTNAESYNLYWSNDSSVTITASTIENVSSPYSHTNLTNGTTYYYAVSAINTTGESPLSRPGHATPLYICIADTLAVRAILDSNGLLTTSVHTFISYSEDGRVKTLDFYNKGLNRLPSEIGNLTALEELKLYNNNLTTIPSEIGNLIHLKWLWLDNNKLPTLPSEIGNLSHLEVLYLDDNFLTSIPSEIGNLTTLRYLYLHHNNLTNLPATIQNLANVTQLYLSYNNINSLPSELGSLSALKLLELNNNNLTSIPTEIGMLTTLEKLELDNNNLGSLPPEIGQLTNLSWLSLDRNALTTLPDSIVNLTPDVYCNLGYNKLDKNTLSDTVIAWADEYDSGWMKTQDTLNTY